LEARHWSDENVLGGRAFFRGDQTPARLALDGVVPSDAGEYRCRVDFYRAPTTIESIVLDVIGESNNITFIGPARTCTWKSTTTSYALLGLNKHTNCYSYLYLVRILYLYRS
jgi:hypothetical protein